MPLIVHFVRHGESRANVEGIFANRVDQPFALTETGLDQARVLADKLQQRDVTHLYTSPLPRARQTAKMIGDACDVPVTVTGSLREYTCGEFEGQPYTGEHAWRWGEHVRIEQAWRDGDLDARHPDGESARDVGARFLPFMDALTSRHGVDDRLALVGHGGLYLVALPMLFENVSVDDARRFGLGHCEIVTATWDAGPWTCLQWGDEDMSQTSSLFP